MRKQQNYTPRNMRESNGVKYWESYNDPNYNNCHAEALGVEFFKFPFSPYMDCVGNKRSIIVSGPNHDYSTNTDYWTIQAGNSQGNGSVAWTGWYKFPDSDQAFTFAAKQVKLDPEAAAEISKLAKAGDWRTIAVFSTHSKYGEAAKLELEYKFGPLTSLQEEVLAGLRGRGHFGIADSVEQMWSMGRLAYVDARTPIPGLRRKFDRANKEALTRIGERVIKGEQA